MNKLPDTIEVPVPSIKRELRLSKLIYAVIDGTYGEVYSLTTTLVAAKICQASLGRYRDIIIDINTGEEFPTKKSNNPY